MKITNQNNHVECGICVINSLVNHYHGIDNKRDILENANLTSDGLSIFEFEVLASKFNLFVESYQLSWNEFISLSHREYMVCPIKQFNALHYVIIKKQKNKIEVYDSSNGFTTMSYAEFNKHFNSIIMFVSKAKTIVNIIKLGQVDMMKTIDLKFLFLSLILQVVIILLGAIAADYLNIIISHAISNKSINNAISISFIFIFIYMLNGLTKYFLGLYTTKKFKINFQYLNHLLLEKIKYKKKSFFNKVNLNYFYLIDTAMQSITNFIVYEVTSFWANAFTIFVVLIFIGLVNPWLLIVNVLGVVLAIIFCYINYKYRQTIFQNGLYNQNNNNDITSKYIHYLTTQHNVELQKDLKQSLEKNYAEFSKIYIKQSKFINLVSFTETLAHDFLYIILIVLSCWLIVENESLNIGEITFVISLVSMFSYSSNSICNYFIKKIEFKQMTNIYLDFIQIDNFESKGHQLIDTINKISVNERNLVNGCKYDREFIEYLTLNETVNYSVQINNLKISDINITSYLDKVFVINPQTKVSKKYLVENFDQTNNIFVTALTSFKINLTSSKDVSIYEQQLLNILACLLQKNKLILLDDCLRYIDEKKLTLINDNILPHIKQNNFLLIFD